MNDLGHLLRRYHANFAKGAKIKKIKIKKIPCVFAVLWYSLTMKKKAPQKSQIWKVGTRCFRIVRIEGGQAVVRHHEEFGKFFLNDLRPASAEEIRAYFKK
jgi:hypothetical protein